MSTPERPDDARDPHLSAAHAAGRESPPAALDAAVLAAARQTVAPRSRPALRRWAPPFALAASLVMGLAFLLAQQVQQDPVAVEEALTSERLAPAQAAPDARRDVAMPMVAKEYAGPERSDAPMNADIAAGAGASSGASSPPEAYGDDFNIPPAELRVPVQPTYPAPALERAAAARAQAQSSEAQRARAEAEEAAETAADDAEDQAHWLAEIQALRDAGQQAEAVRQLMAFCEAYPGHEECPEQ